MLLLMSVAFAKDIVVQPNGTNDSLRIAIKEAESGDRIVLQRGSYEECVSTMGKDIILYGEKDAQIVGNGSCDSLLSVSSGEVWLQNLRFKNKNTCISVLNRGALLQVENAQFIDCGNTKSRGGAIYVEGGSLRIRSSRFSKNTGDKGASIHAKDAAVHISDTILSDNIAQVGAAVYSAQSELTIVDSRIFGNKTKSGGFGAGIAIRNRTILHLQDVQFQNNHAQGKGGAIYADTTAASRRNQLLISDSEFSDNSASFGSSAGGAIYIRGLSNTEIKKSSFSNNIAANSGGAIALYDIEEEALFEECVFSKNRARGGNGGAIMVEAANPEKSGLLVLRNSRLIENRAETYGGALSIGSSVNPFGSAEVEDTLFKRNQANSSQSGAGGAIYYVSSAPFTFRVRNSEFVENKAELSGGAIYAYQPQQMDVVDSKFVHNQARGASTAQARYGGGLMIDGAKVLTVERSRFCHNIAASSGAERVSGIGGGVYLQKIDRALIQDSWLWENNAQQKGGAIAAEQVNLRLSELVFAGNRANQGAAVFSVDGSTEARDSIFSYSQAGIAVSGEGDFSENEWYSNADGHIAGGEQLQEKKPSFSKIVIDGRCDDDLSLQSD